jgi:hypothetical protein
MIPHTPFTLLLVAEHTRALIRRLENHYIIGMMIDDSHKLLVDQFFYSSVYIHQSSLSSQRGKKTVKTQRIDITYPATSTNPNTLHDFHRNRPAGSTFPSSQLGLVQHISSATISLEHLASLSSTLSHQEITIQYTTKSASRRKLTRHVSRHPLGAMRLYVHCEFRGW